MGSSTAAPRERPILFRDEMVRAILDGRKVQTRRPVRNKYGVCDACFVKSVPHDKGDGGMGVFGSAAYLRVPACDHNDMTGGRVRCPYGVPGDRLVVKERWATLKENDDVAPGDLPDLAPIWWAAGDGVGRRTGRWRASIHLPLRFARLLLEVTAVRVERVQAITEADARAEGFEAQYAADNPIFRSASSQFYEVWQAMYGKPAKGKPDLSWAANPFVWCVTFERVEARDAR